MLSAVILTDRRSVAECFCSYLCGVLSCFVIRLQGCLYLSRHLYVATYVTSVMGWKYSVLFSFIFSQFSILISENFCKKQFVLGKLSNTVK